MWQRFGPPWAAAGRKPCVLPFRQKADAELGLRVANAEARISAFEQKVSERESTRATAEAAEEDVNVEVQQLEKQEAAANEI